MKYKVQLSMFGTVAERANVVIEAENEKEAKKIALEKLQQGDIEFSNEQECVDGWDYQVEGVEKEEQKIQGEKFD